MKTLIPHLILSVTLLCCNFKQDQPIYLFNDISFKLIDGEEVVKIDANKINIFNSYFNNKSVQIPLFKCIKSDSHMIFLGIPFSTSVKELTNFCLINDTRLTSFESDSINYLYETHNSEKEQIAIYTKNFSNNLVFVLAVSKSAKLSDSLFNLRSLSNRFNM